MESEAATWALLALSAVLVAVGLVGMLLPVIPGAPVLLAGLALAAWAEDFAFVGYGTLTVLGLLALLSYAVDFGAGIFGARRFGATRRGMLGAALGALIGLFFGIPGIVLGPFAGAVLGELSGQRRLQEAGRAGVGASLGLVLGAAAKLALAFSMLGIFAAVRILGAL